MRTKRVNRVAVSGLAIDTKMIECLDDYQQAIDMNLEITEHIEYLKSQRDFMKASCKIEFRSNKVTRLAFISKEIHSAGILKIQLQGRQAELKMQRHFTMQEYVVDFARKLCPDELWREIIDGANVKFIAQENKVKEERVKRELAEYAANEILTANYMSKLENRRYV